METISLFGYWIPYLSAYALQGYPPPRYIIPALEAIGYKVDFININDLRKSNVSPLSLTQKETSSDLRMGLKACNSNKLIVSYWDYIFKRDLKTLFSDPSKKMIFCINWQEEPKTIDEKIAIMSKSSYVTCSLEHYRNQWFKDVPSEITQKYQDQMKVTRFPCTLGATLDKELCRKQLGITTSKSVLLWGYYGAGKGANDVLEWCQSMFETSVLFAGTPASPSAGDYLLAKAVELNMKERVFFSRPLISDSEADLWFSAADVVLVPYWYKIGESSLSYALGHGKACITSDLYCFEEYEKKYNAIITSPREKFKETFERYLNDVNAAHELEERARQYAQKFNWITLSLEYKKMLDTM